MLVSSTVRRRTFGERSTVELSSSALYAATGRRHPVAASTAVYVLATTATRNPSLVLASGVMGALFGLQRRATGGIQAPLITHLTWSILMLRFLPPLFRHHSLSSGPDLPTDTV